MKIVDIRGRTFESSEELRRLVSRGEIEVEKYEDIVKEILQEVRDRGDEALIAYTEKFDKVKLTAEDIQIPFEELEKAYEEIEDELKWSLEIAIERVREFHEAQRENSYFKEEDGIIIGQKVIPIEKVGLYVPGGKAAYPSTVIMNAIPAQVAGVKEIIMVSPNPNKYTLAAAFLCGIETVYRIGGAQAIGALAFGTETVKKVDKIV